MTEAYGDAVTAPFWEAASNHQLVVQRCAACGHHQLYPRPFCLRCYSDDVLWTPVAGAGFVYSQTTVSMTDQPYTVALVTLVEGPRLMTHIVGQAVEIGDEVTLGWRERPDAPPLPIFTAARGDSPL